MTGMAELYPIVLGSLLESARAAAELDEAVQLRLQKKKKENPRQRGKSGENTPKKQAQEAAKVARQQTKIERDRGLKQHAEERAASRALKKQQRDAATAAKSQDAANNRKRESSHNAAKNPTKRRCIVAAASSRVDGGPAAASPPPKRSASYSSAELRHQRDASSANALETSV